MGYKGAHHCSTETYVNFDGNQTLYCRDRGGQPDETERERLWSCGFYCRDTNTRTELVSIEHQFSRRGRTGTRERQRKMRISAANQMVAASRPKDHPSIAGDEDLRRTATVNAGRTTEDKVESGKRSRRRRTSPGRLWRARRGQRSNGADKLGENLSQTEVGEDAHGVNLERHPLDFL
jgi:hypothetical protein